LDPRPQEKYACGIDQSGEHGRARKINHLCAIGIFVEASATFSMRCPRNEDKLVFPAAFRFPVNQRFLPE